MISPDNSFLNQIDSTSNSELEQRRLLALANLGISDSGSIPVFDEAVQTAAHFLDASICVLSFVEQDRQCFKATIGLSRIGLMNDLATSRQLPRGESFCDTVVGSQRALAIEDATAHPNYENSLLVRRYGIHAYLGVPLFDSEGYCLGTLAVMELAPRQFSSKDMGFLELIARWSMSEVERNQLLKKQQDNHSLPSSGQFSIAPSNSSAVPLGNQSSDAATASTVKANLIAQMVQELRTPLTSILGMASVLNREIYGPLTNKQKEYLDIIHTSSQSMLSLVNDTVELGSLDALKQSLDLSHVDLEMFCQQCLSTLQEAAHQREQDISLTVEPGQRTWILDKTKVKQMLYHLVFRVIQASNPGSRVRIHVSRKTHQIHISIWTSHPWLGEGLPHTELYYESHALLDSAADTLNPSYMESEHGISSSSMGLEAPMQRSTSPQSVTTTVPEAKTRTSEEKQMLQTRQNLGLILCRTLVEMHGGNLSIQGSLEAGYRYVLSLPYLQKENGTV